MKCLSQIRVESVNGVVRVVFSDGMEEGCVALSPEAARNLIADLDEHARVADLDNEEWKSEREDSEYDERKRLEAGTDALPCARTDSAAPSEGKDGGT